MQPTDVSQLSADAWLALMPVLFKRRGYKLEGCVLWLKGKKARHLAYCMATPATLSVNDLRMCIPARIQSQVTFSYVVTRGQLSPDAVASFVPWEMQLVDGVALQEWLRLAALM